MKLPRKVSPNPIIQTVVEIRFSPKPPEDAVFGMLFRELSGRFPNLENLPILQIPEAVRNQDLGLKFQPWYKMSGSPGILMIGPRVVAFAVESYDTWEPFSQNLTNVFQGIMNQDLLLDIQRLAIRYVNFFPKNVLEKINLKLEMMGQSLVFPPTYVRTEIARDGLKCLLQITNEANVVIHGDAQKGSIIDLDTFQEVPELPQRNAQAMVDFVHRQNQLCKEVFFGLISGSLLDELKPEY